MTLGDKLSKLRKENKFTQEQLVRTIFIESPLTKNLVSCFKVTVSPVLTPAKNQPKYLLLGVDKITFFGEHTTQLGWYETEEDIQKEMSEITSAIREGKNCYTLKYNVDVDIKSFSVEMKKAQDNDKHTKFPKALLGVLVLFCATIAFYFGGSMIERISDEFGLSLNELIMGDITVKMKIIAIVLLRSGTYWLSRT